MSADDKDAIYDALLDAVGRYKAVKRPAENTLRTARDSAWARFDRDRLSAEIAELSDKFLGHYPDATPEAIDDWHESLKTEMFGSE